MIWSMFTNETEFVVKIFHKVQGQMTSLMNSSKHLGNNTNSTQTLPEKFNMLEHALTYSIRPELPRQKHVRKLQTNIPHEHKRQFLNIISAKQI